MSSLAINVALARLMVLALLETKAEAVFHRLLSLSLLLLDFA
jgi:hypothetical protein